MTTLSTRRGFLKGVAAVGGGAAALGFAHAFGLQSASAAHNANDEPQTILNLAATAETLAVSAYYYTVLNNPLDFEAAAVAYLKLAMSAELYHLDFLTSAGGRALTDKFYVPEKFLSDRAMNTAIFTAAETAFVGAYLAATRRFAELGNPRLAATAAQHAASETEHLALLRDIGGLVPNPNGLPAPIYYNVSDAVPTLAPFLQGGSGFVGPVPFPGKDAVMQLAGDLQAVRVPVFLNVF
ncbi:MAG TPA: twin-arginine translocation signal domain-containing protein [Roseiflexaceae bacterium]|nr:twin-arginine translocation signal domain-containing protein [Roseiflexaceae bacterium]